MGDLSKNFNRYEFACKCGRGFDSVSLELVRGLQELRDQFNEPVIITSGCRCVAWNKKVGGVVGSQHTLGNAADVRIIRWSPAIVAVGAAKIEGFFHGGIAVYPNFTHLDVRGKTARWGLGWNSKKS